MKHNYYTLSRRPFEELIFQITDSSGTKYEVSQVISNIQGNQVRLSLKTPENIKLLNHDLYEAEQIDLRRESGT